MLRRNPQPCPIIHRLERRGTEELTLFTSPTNQMVRHPIDFVTAKHADDMVNLGEFVQQRWAESLWQTARDDDTLSFSGSFEIEHFPDHRFGFGA